MKYIYELINIGKGTYGSGSLQITPENLLLIYTEELNNEQVVVESGQIDNLEINKGVSLLIFTNASSITGIIPIISSTVKSIRIYNDTGNNFTIKTNDNSSLVANQFDIGSDFVIPDKQFKTFIYIQSKWRIEA
jgi:hypothetical protein